MRTPRIVLTPGEPAGIGPELARGLVGDHWNAELIVVGARSLTPDLPPFDPDLEPQAGRIAVRDVALRKPAQPGQLDPANADYVLETLDVAIGLCRDGQADALVTGPVHKGVICEAGHAFTGHTEYLSAALGVARVVMMLACPGLRVALVTTHVPLGQVAPLIRRDRIIETLHIVDSDLKSRFGIAAPRIAVCGLNPHAGEGGHLGREELDEIEPALAACRAAGLAVTGPWPADTVFTPPQIAAHDAIVAMYHDQGLPVLKHLGFGRAINITLGLGIIRTSVDHGTAVDIAGTGQADPGSLHAALAEAIRMASASAAVA